MHNKNNNQRKVSGDPQFGLSGSLKNTGPHTLKKFLKIIEEQDIHSAEDMERAMEKAGIKGTVIEKKNHSEVEIDLTGEQECDGVGCPVHSKEKTLLTAADLKNSLLEKAIERKLASLEKEIADQKKPKKTPFFSFRLRERFFLSLLGAFALSELYQAYVYFVAGNGAASFEAVNTSIWIVFAGAIDACFTAYVLMNKTRIAAFKENGLLLTKKIRLSIEDANKKFTELQRLNDAGFAKLETVIKQERAQKAALQSERDVAVNELKTLKDISAKVDAFNKQNRVVKRKKPAKKAVKKLVTE